MPPRVMAANQELEIASEKAPIVAARTAMRYETNAVVSLSSVSPSRIVTSRAGKPQSSEPTAVVTSASGECDDGPGTKADAHGRSATTSCATTATVHIVISTRATASRKIEPALRLVSRRDPVAAAVYVDQQRDEQREDQVRGKVDRWKEGEGREEPGLRQPAQWRSARRVCARNRLDDGRDEEQREDDFEVVHWALVVHAACAGVRSAHAELTSTVLDGS